MKNGIFVSSGAAGNDIDGMCEVLASAVDQREQRHDLKVLVINTIAFALALGYALDFTHRMLASTIGEKKVEKMGKISKERRGGLNNIKGQSVASRVGKADDGNAEMEGTKVEGYTKRTTIARVRKTEDGQEIRFGRFHSAWSCLYPLRFVWTTNTVERRAVVSGLAPIKSFAAVLIMFSHSFRWVEQDLITWIFPAINPKQHSIGNIGLTVLLVCSGYTVCARLCPAKSPLVLPLTLFVNIFALMWVQCALGSMRGNSCSRSPDLYAAVECAKALARRLGRILLPYCMYLINLIRFSLQCI